jgi:hypothetical protein
LNNQPYPDPHQPQTATGNDEILAAIALGLARAQTCGQYYETVPPLIDDLVPLAGKIARLHDTLITERLRSANLLAAIRAALGAAADGEADPLAYLRYEIPGYAGGDAYGA